MSIGVYAIIDEEMGQIVYIGCSKILEERWNIFRRELRRGVLRQKELQDIYARLGSKGLSFEILEETSLGDRFSTEKKWIELYQPIANIWHTPRHEAAIESRRELLKGRSNLSPETIERIHQQLRGKKLSEQARENMSKAHLGKPWSEKRKAVGQPKGKKMPPRSEETRRKMSEASKGKTPSLETREKLRQRSLEMWAKRKGLSV